MYATQYFEELRSIISRMDRLLPPTHEEQGEHTQKEGGGHQRNQKYAVIEARATDIQQVQHQRSGWLFRESVPSLHQGQESRRAFVANRTSHLTYMKGEAAAVAKNDAELPSGITLWHATDTARRTLLLARRDLDLFFSSNLEKLLPHDKEMGVFALPNGKELCFRDCMALIQGHAPYLHKICWEYAALASHIYGLSLAEFEVISRVLVQRLYSQSGKPCRLLETRQARYDGGPVLVISLGLPKTAHDLSPTLMQGDQGKEYPVRVFVPEGVMTVIDGDARFRYSHGFPMGQEGGNTFYTITMFMDCTGQTSIAGYEKETRTLIMSTPMQMEHIITIRPAIASHTNIHTSLQRDTLWRIVQAMRMRLRSAESHLITKKYKRWQEDGGLSSTEVSKR